MSLKVLTLIFSVLANLVIAIYVISKGWKKPHNQALAIFILTIVVWGLSTLLLNMTDDINRVMLFGHFCFATAILTQISFFRFSVVFPSVVQMSKKVNFALYSSAGALFILSFTRLIQQDVIILDGEFRPQLGVLYPFYVFFHISCVTLSLSCLRRKWIKRKKGMEALQLKIIFTGIFISAFFMIGACLILPALGVAQLVALGPGFSVIIVGSIAYAIFKYRFLDIALVVRKTLLYAVTTGAVTVIYIALVLVGERLFREFAQYQTLFPAFLSAMIIAIFFHPLRERLQKFVDKCFYRKKYEYQKTLRDTSMHLTKVLSLPELLGKIVENITGALGVEKAFICLSEKDSHLLKASSELTGSEEIRYINYNGELAAWIKKHNKAAIRDELVQTSHGAVRELEQMGAEIAIPINGKEGLRGIIFISGKKSGHIFTQEDIDLFMTVASQASVAIENALLYTKLEEEKLYKDKILSCLSCGVITVDSAGGIRLFNRKAADITGLLDTSPGVSINKIFDDTITGIVLDAIGGKTGLTNMEVDYKNSTKEKIPLALSIAPMRSGRHEDNGAVIVLVDLTETKKLEYELRQSEKLASLGTIAASMAHKIKNPLVAINTFMELFPEKYSDEKFRINFSQTAAREAQRINDIVQRLLDMTHDRVIDFKETNIHRMIDETFSLLDSVLEKNSVKIIRDYTTQAVTAFTDEESFRDVLLNIFYNSIESFDKKGGTISVKTAREFSQSDSEAPDSEEIVIHIRDNGCGIPDDILPKIFDPFFTNKTKGTGLGLFSVRKALINHGGSIKVRETILNKGTCFELRIPAKAQEPINRKPAFEPSRAAV